MLEEREIGRDQPIRSPLGMTPPRTRLPGDEYQGKDQWEQETNNLKQISAPGFIAKGVKSRKYSWQYPSHYRHGSPARREGVSTAPPWGLLDAHKSSLMDLICRAWRSEQSSSIMDAGKSQLSESSVRLGSLPAARVVRTLELSSQCPLGPAPLGLRELP